MNQAFIVYSMLMIIISLVYDTFIVKYVTPIRRKCRLALGIYFAFNLLQYGGEWYLSTFCSYEIYDRYTGRLVMACLLMLFVWGRYFWNEKDLFYEYGKMCLYYLSANMTNSLCCLIGSLFAPGAWNRQLVQEWSDFPAVLVFTMAGALGVGMVYIMKHWGILERAPKALMRVVGILLTIVGSSSFFMQEFGTLLLYAGRIKYAMVIYVSIPMLFVFICLLFYYIYLLCDANYRIKMDLKQQYSYYAILSDIQLRVRALRHDLVNHQAVLTSMNKVDNEKAAYYVEKLMQEIEEVREREATSGNAMDMLVAYSVSEFERTGVALQVSVRSDENTGASQEVENYYILSSVLEYLKDVVRDGNGQKTVSAEKAVNVEMDGKTRNVRVRCVMSGDGRRRGRMRKRLWGEDMYLRRYVRTKGWNIWVEK